MSRVCSIQNYNFSESDDIFIDTNIWIYIYGPQTNPDDWRARIYSRALGNILKAGSRILIDVLVLSEFINTYARIIHRPIKKARGTEFKEWRKSPEFKETAENIADASRRIIKRCSRIESGFESTDINTVLNDYQAKQPDFNDQVFTELCKARGMKLITHDTDFKDSDLAILTGNNKLLN